MLKNILVTGANGQLGHELQALSKVYGDYDFTFIDRNTFDLGDPHAVESYFSNQMFDAMINCAAYTAVDRAESEPEAAYAVNRGAVEMLARIAKSKNISLVHISTDYVFDGSHFKPYVEKDHTNPQGVYGQSKLEGEEAMMAIDPPRSVIIRTSWVYSSFGGNFVKTMLRLGKERDELGVVFDQVGSPTYARDLAKTILDILPQLQSSGTEIYHYSNEGVASWYDFAVAVFELAGLECRVRPIETADFPTPAVRPHYSLLNKQKIKADFGIEIPYWRDSLQVCLQRILNGEC